MTLKGFLDGQAARAVKLSLEIIAVAAALWGIVLAKDAFDDQRRLSAYQLLEIVEVSSIAKWSAAQTILGLDRSVYGLSTNCKEQPAIPDGEVVIPCPDLQDVRIEGSRGSGRLIARSTIPSTHFVGGVLREVTFSASDLSSSSFQAVELDNVTFSDSVLKDTDFWLRPNRGKERIENPERSAIEQWWFDRFSALPTRVAPKVEFVRSDLSRVVVTGDDLRRIKISNSNVTRMQLVGKVDPTLFVGSGNYYIGLDEPMLVSESSVASASFIAEWVCPVAVESIEPRELNLQAHCRRL